ncbi:MAG TPA: MarR family transcriptional regulator [Streptosporangiaceae bacterium]|nr:MarR family transcriptional regulator [Streptosporangiaceae bacterium]
MSSPPSRLGYLLKHAQQRLTELTGPALAPYGISGRELAVLLTLAGCEPASQQQAAQRLGVDRTTMVGLVDALEAKNLVARRAQESDRRRNVVELTEAGRETVRRAGQAAAQAEREFLAPLTPDAAAQFVEALRTLVPPPAE